jgi:hypothetical protein
VIGIVDDSGPEGLEFPTPAAAQSGPEAWKAGACDRNPLPFLLAIAYQDHGVLHQSIIDLELLQRHIDDDRCMPD